MVGRGVCPIIYVSGDMRQLSRMLKGLQELSGKSDRAERGPWIATRHQPGIAHNCHHIRDVEKGASYGMAARPRAS